jgi:hypothetical protein
MQDAARPMPQSLYMPLFSSEGLPSLMQISRYTRGIGGLMEHLK